MVSPFSIVCLVSSSDSFWLGEGVVLVVVVGVSVGVVWSSGVGSVFFFGWSIVFAVSVVSPSCVGDVCVLSGVPGVPLSSVAVIGVTLGAGFHSGL